MSNDQGWQPIETAPKDGTRVLVHCAATNEQFVVACLTALEDRTTAWVISRSVGSEPVAFVCRDPTRRRPLPEPPTDAGSGV